MLTNILQAIGNTPLLRLGLSQDLPGKVWLKLENRNPGGSIKDRVAFHLIENALQWGELEPGGLFVRIVTALANDEPLPERLRDHALGGNWKDHRDCHIRPDLVLIYRKPDADTLQLVRIGSHSELGL